MFEHLWERPGELRRWKLALVVIAVVAAVVGVVALGGVQRRRPGPPAPAAGLVVVGGGRQTAPPAATATAAGFLRSYLRFLYGRVGARQLRGVTRPLRRALATRRGRVTPAERARRPRLVGLGFAPDNANRGVFFEADVSDGASRYRVRLRVARRTGRWLVVELPDTRVAVGPNGAD